MLIKSQLLILLLGAITVHGALHDRSRATTAGKCTGHDQGIDHLLTTCCDNYKVTFLVYFLILPFLMCIILVGIEKHAMENTDQHFEHHQRRKEAMSSKLIGDCFIEGSKCKLDNFVTGTCLRLEQCPYERTRAMAGLEPVLCSTRHPFELVCCRPFKFTDVTDSSPEPEPALLFPDTIPGSSKKKSSSNRPFDYPTKTPAEDAYSRRPPHHLRPASSSHNSLSSEDQLGELRPSGPHPHHYHELPDPDLPHPSSSYSPDQNVHYSRPSGPPPQYSHRYPDQSYRPVGISPDHRHHPASGQDPPRRPLDQTYVPKPSPPIWSSLPAEPAHSQETARRPDSRRISEQKCSDYTRLWTEPVVALPLLPESRPSSTRVQKNCQRDSAPLVVGGVDARPHEFPHMAAIGYRQERGRIGWFCGGTLISERFVLTAAHCADTVHGPPVVIRLGEHNLNSDDDESDPVDIPVSSILRHPQYAPPSRYHDIALLRLQRSVSFSSSIRPACLHNSETVTSKPLIATGWGHTDPFGGKSPILQKVGLNRIDHRTCDNLYREINGTTNLARGILHEVQMCAGVLSGGRDTCQGDSGGPLQVTSRTNYCIFHVVGITSFGKLCGSPNAPGVYTRVSHYLSWIEGNVWPGL